MPRPSTTSNVHSQALSIGGLLIEWQKKAGRHDLPWQVRDPYRVWLSEIMLQQTQVTTVIPYYLRFLERFPQLQALALAKEEAVLEAWSGLGYYSRARNLHRCAQIVMNDYGGRFPASIELLQTLPGIGRSTAAAIAVFCFSKNEAILDGNVKRVLSRVFAIAGIPTQSSTERELWQIALGQVPKRDIESYTQGLMDLGASLCGPRHAKCPLCPLSPVCASFRMGLTHCLPSPKIRKTTPQREQTFALIVVQGRVLLEKQKAPGIWGGLLSLPQIGSLKLIQARHGLLVPEPLELPGFDHSFTHFKLRARVLKFHLEEAKPLNDSARAANEPGAFYDGQAAPEYRTLDPDQIASSALPQPIKAYLLEHADQLSN
jgi:A/G-specific adenine glycosylase